MALADLTRRAILQRLARGEERVTTLAEPVPMSLNAVSKHITLSKGGASGGNTCCRLIPLPSTKPRRGLPSGAPSSVLSGNHGLRASDPSAHVERAAAGRPLRCSLRLVLLRLHDDSPRGRRNEPMGSGRRRHGDHPRTPGAVARARRSRLRSCDGGSRVRSCRRGAAVKFIAASGCSPVSTSRRPDAQGEQPEVLLLFLPPGSHSETLPRPIQRWPGI